MLPLNCVVVAPEMFMPMVMPLNCTVVAPELFMARCAAPEPLLWWLLNCSWPTVLPLKSIVVVPELFMAHCAAPELYCCGA